MNWSGHVIQDSFDGVVFHADTTIYFDSDYTFSFQGLRLNYFGTADLTFASSSTTSRNTDFEGNVFGDFGGPTSAVTVTFGSEDAPLDIPLDGGTRDISVNSGDAFVLDSAVTYGTLQSNGQGVLRMQNGDLFNGVSLILQAGEPPAEIVLTLQQIQYPTDPWNPNNPYNFTEVDISTS